MILQKKGYFLPASAPLLPKPSTNLSSSSISIMTTPVPARCAPCRPLSPPPLIPLSPQSHRSVQNTHHTRAEPPPPRLQVYTHSWCLHPALGRVCEAAMLPAPFRVTFALFPQALEHSPQPLYSCVLCLECSAPCPPRLPPLTFILA